jgi:hypothetical protein
MCSGDHLDEGCARASFGTMIAATEPLAARPRREHFGGLRGVTKRIASTIKRLFQHRVSIDLGVFPSGNSRETACASMRERR